jgi:hypothetical protein
MTHYYDKAKQWADALYHLDRGDDAPMKALGAKYSEAAWGGDPSIFSAPANSQEAILAAATHHVLRLGPSCGGYDALQWVTQEVTEATLAALALAAFDGDRMPLSRFKSRCAPHLEPKDGEEVFERALRLSVAVDLMHDLMHDVARGPTGLSDNPCSASMRWATPDEEQR